MAEARRRRKKKQQSEYFFDYSLLFIVLFLLGFGLIMIYSASSYEAYDTYGDAAFYMKKQLVANIIGLVGMIIIANIPYHFWERFHSASAPTVLQDGSVFPIRASICSRLR